MNGKLFFTDIEDMEYFPVPQISRSYVDQFPKVPSSDSPSRPGNQLGEPDQHQ